MMPRFFASSRLMASTPTPKFEMISSLGSASISLPSTGIGPKVASPRTVCACRFRNAARSAASNSLWQVNSFCSVAMVPAWPCAVRMISAFIVSGLEFGGERLLRFDLHQQADFMVRALGVVLDPAEARGARGARNATYARRRVTRIGHRLLRLSRRGNVGDEQRLCTDIEHALDGHHVVPWDAQYGVGGGGRRRLQLR